MAPVRFARGEKGFDVYIYPAGWYAHLLLCRHHHLTMGFRAGNRFQSHCGLFSARKLPLILDLDQCLMETQHVIYGRESSSNPFCIRPAKPSQGQWFLCFEKNQEEFDCAKVVQGRIKSVQDRIAKVRKSEASQRDTQLLAMLMHEQNEIRTIIEVITELERASTAHGDRQPKWYRVLPFFPTKTILVIT